MLYSEFKATYKATIKKFPDITALFREEPEKVITCHTIRQIKTGSRWTTTEETTDKIDFIHYINVLDGIPFFRNLGGSETVQKAYTKAGLIPVRLLSTNPDRTQRTIREFTF